MDFKKFGSETEAFFNRAIQATEEWFGQAEKTEYDPNFTSLVQRADKTKDWTEKLIKQMEAVLQPNPAARAEQMFLESFQSSTRTTPVETDVLGELMIGAGNDFGPGTSYGSALVKCGQVHQKLAEIRRKFCDAVTKSYIQPLKAFLDNDMKTILKERKVLETKRLDLDAAKNKLKRAKPENKTTVEGELRVVQVEYDRQLETTKLLLEGVASTHAHHLRCLQDFIEAEQEYIANSHQVVKDMVGQMGIVSVPASNSTESS